MIVENSMQMVQVCAQIQNLPSGGVDSNIQSMSVPFSISTCKSDLFESDVVVAMHIIMQYLH